MRSIIAVTSLIVPLLSTAHADWRNPTPEAVRIAQKTIILDGHVDIPYRIQRSGEDISGATASGDFDYPRAFAGGFNAPFMAIYVAATFQPEANGGAKEQADKLIDLVYGIAENAPHKFEVAKSVADVKRITKELKIALPMGMENGAPVEDDVKNVDYFYDRGVRYMGLAHSRANQLADSSYDVNRPWGGLSPLGKDVVKRMNKVGMIVDVSHVSDEAFYDILEVSMSPVIASHSSARRYTPGFERNMDDDMIKALAENGGVIMINFGSSFLSEDYQQWRAAYQLAFAKHLEATGQDGTRDVNLAFEREYVKENPKPFADVDTVLDHIDHVVDLVGVEHVGLGSDYDGVGDSLPIGLKDASTMPHLVQGLMDRGYKKRHIQKILSGNGLRVWRQVEQMSMR